MRAYYRIAVPTVVGWLCALVVLSSAAAATTPFAAAAYNYDRPVSHARFAPTSGHVSTSISISMTRSSTPLRWSLSPRSASFLAAEEARGADFVIDSRGTAIPTDPARLRAGLEDSGAFTETSTSPATSRKFVGVDDGEPIRIRVERGHPEDPNYTGPGDPLHTVDHLHVDRRANGATGPWQSVWKIPYNWPWG